MDGRGTSLRPGQLDRGKRVQKFAVHYRLDMRMSTHLSTVQAIHACLKSCMLEPVRVNEWEHLKSMYFITTEDGPAMAKMLHVMSADFEFIYAGLI